MEQIKKQRLPFYDNLKFVLIILVVMEHWCELGNPLNPVNHFVVIFFPAFLMPLFVFLSGLFYKREKAIERAMEYFLIGCLYKVLVVVLQAIVIHKQISHELLVFKLLQDDGPSWYIFMIAAFQLLMYPMKNLNLRLVLAITLLVGVFAGYDHDLGAYMYFLRIAVYFPFFVMGKMTTKETIDRLRSIKVLKIVSIAVLALWAVAVLLHPQIDSIKPLLRGFDSFVDSNNTPIYNGYILRPICYAVSVLTGVSVLTLIPNKEIKPITAFGSRTLQVYFWHIALILPFNTLGFITKMSQKPAQTLITLLIPAAITIVLSLKPFGFPLNRLRIKKTND